jgi:predicted methyltransferase
MGFRGLSFAVLAAVVMGGAAPSLADPPATLAAAVADPARPAADVARDADRKPLEMLAFAQVKPGDTVLELIPGGGYFTRLLAKAVGPTGVVLAASPAVIPGADKVAKEIAADPRYGNVKAVGFDGPTLMDPQQVDVIFTAQNYHDLHLTQAKQDVPLLDRLFFDKLKHGGLLIIIDHAALPGSPVVATADTLHRIDPAVVKTEVEGAGFVFDGESPVLRNPDDPHTKIVFDPSIRGKTDQFVFRFKKP